MKHTNTVFWEKLELRYVKACGTCNNHWALKGEIHCPVQNIIVAIFTSQGGSVCASLNASPHYDKLFSSLS
jgi:hypothetical protein